MVTVHPSTGSTVGGVSFAVLVGRSAGGPALLEGFRQGLRQGARQGSGQGGGQGSRPG